MALPDVWSTKSFHQHLPTMTEHGPLMQLAVVFLVSGM
jgi:hypothetical protein